VTGPIRVNAVKIQSLFDSMHAVLGIYLTNKCNMMCRHCSVQSGPGEKAHLAVEGVLREIEELASDDLLRGLHISGGEPLLFPDDVRTLSTLGRQLGLPVAVATNASWATTFDKARHLLSRLPGVSQLLISTDVYHQEFAPVERAVNAAAAALDVGLTVTVNICRPRGAVSTTVENFKELLASHGDQIDVVTSDLELGGRADNLKEARWRSLSPDLPSGGCMQVRRPVILENKSVLACCNTTVAKRVSASPLNAGTIGGSANLRSLLFALRSDPIIQILNVFGPSYFAQRLSHAARRLLQKEYVIGDICSLCADMMSDQTITTEIKSIAESPDTQARLATALSFLPTRVHEMRSGESRGAR
jgi:pyruvate-formate lyase-activating enzyme